MCCLGQGVVSLFLYLLRMHLNLVMVKFSASASFEERRLFSSQYETVRRLLKKIWYLRNIFFSSDLLFSEMLSSCSNLSSRI